MERFSFFYSAAGLFDGFVKRFSWCLFTTENTDYEKTPCLSN